MCRISEHHKSPQKSIVPSWAQLKHLHSDPGDSRRDEVAISVTRARIEKLGHVDLQFNHVFFTEHGVGKCT